MLLREEPRADDQSLTDLACYPGEASLVKMLYRAGFAVVYRVTPLPQHDDFRDTPDHSRKRTVLLASHSPIDLAGVPVCTRGGCAKRAIRGESLRECGRASRDASGDSSRAR